MSDAMQTRVDALQEELRVNMDDSHSDYVIAEALGLTHETRSPSGVITFSSTAGTPERKDTVAESLGLLRDGRIIGRYTEADIETPVIEKFDPAEFAPGIPDMVFNPDSPQSLRDSEAFKALVVQMRKEAELDDKRREKEYSATGVKPNATGMIAHIDKMLAGYYTHGFGTEKDCDSAFKFALEGIPIFTAEVQLYSATQVVIGNEMDGDAFAEIYQRAFQSFERAAQEGDKRAAVAVGYYNSQGDEMAKVRRDYGLAKKYFALAGESFEQERGDLGALATEHISDHPKESERANFLLELLNSFVQAVVDLFTTKGTREINDLKDVVSSLRKHGASTAETGANEEEGQTQVDQLQDRRARVERMRSGGGDGRSGG